MTEAQDHKPEVPAGPASSLLKHLPGEGLFDSPVPGVRLFRADRPDGRTPCIYDPCILFVIQGAKRGYLGSQAFDYTPANYMLFSVPMPMEGEITRATPDRPFLGVAVDIVPALIADVRMQVEWSDAAPDSSPRSVALTRMDDGMAAALGRLFASFGTVNDARVLGPMVVREIHYRTLMGNLGNTMLSAAGRHGHYERIHQLLRVIQTDCSASLDTAAMAEIARMSKSSLHDSFKAITSMTPLQYLKSIRLHRARTLMVNERLSAGAAAYRVGYTSPSQFSREFKRLFGYPPSVEAQLDRVPELQ